MLHIILGILKIIAIVLGVLLGLLLLILLSLLFVPLRYRGKVKRDGEGLAAAGRVTWLAHAVSVQMTYENGDTRLTVRLLGISLESIQRLLQRITERKGKRQQKRKKKEAELKTASSEDTEALEQVGKSVQQALEDGRENPDAAPPPPRKAPNTEKKQNRFRQLLQNMKAWIQKLFHLPEKITNIFRNISLTVRNIYGKMKAFLELVRSEEFLGARTLVWGELRKLLKRLGPTKIKGVLSFGFDDPALTGQALAGLSLFYPRFGDKLQIYPYFDRKILETDMYLRGRIYGFYLLAMVWKLYRDSNIKYMIKRFKHKEE